MCIKSKETSRLISTSIDNLCQTKTSQSSEAERFFLDALAEIGKSAKSISGNENKVTGAAAEAARNILLGENGPVNKLNQLVDRLFFREREATKWLKNAMARP